MPPVFRFAPSPNGYLHLGHAYSALLNFDSARQAGGRFLLRIEDIDATRCRPEFEAAIYEDLAWLGITWETPVRRQSEHLPVYREAIEKLSGLGLVYPAFESRAEIARLVAEREAQAPWPRDPDGAPLYPGAAKRLSPDERARLIEIRRALRAAARYGSGARAGRRLDLDRARRRSRRRDGHRRRAAGSLGRRHPGAQGDADQLPSLGGDRRRPAGRDRRRAGAGPVLVDRRPSAAAATAWPAVAPPTGTTASSSMPPAESCRSRPRPPGFANSAARGRRRPISAAWSACLNCGRRCVANRLQRGKIPSGVTPRVPPWHGGDRPGSGESWRQNRAHGAPRGLRKSGRRKSALPALPPARRASRC